MSDRISLLLVLAVLGVYASSTAAIESFFGFQEGTRRNVTCMDGGYFRGMVVHVGHEGQYKEDFVTGVRLLCTSFHIDIEYWGRKSDSFLFGGKGKSENPADMGRAQSFEVVCPDGAGITWLEWREADFWEGQSGEFRVGGFTLRCSDGTNKVHDLRASENLKHNHSDGCKTPGTKLTGVEMWFASENFNGMTALTCR